MRMRLIIVSLIIATFILIDCSAEINPTRCEIDVMQGNTNIPCEIGSFDFGNVSLQSELNITFTIVNTGNDDLKLIGTDPISILGANNNEFIVSTSNTKLTVLPNISTTFEINFIPTAIGKRTATIEIVNNDRDENPYTFVISGTCTQPAPEIHVKQGINDILNNSGSYDFGLVNVNSTANPITFTIENNGFDDLKLTGNPELITISGTDSTMFIVDEILTQTTIQSGNSTTFTISFSPTSAGMKTANVSILNNDSDENPYTFTLYGTGIAAPEINVKQGTTDITNGSSTYDFGIVLINSTSPNVIFTIENIGESTLNLSDAPDCVKIIGTDPTMFSVNQSSIKESLQPGESTSFSLKFSATSVGPKTATISIANNDSDENPFTFTIKGNAVDHGYPIGWIGGGSDGWKTDSAPIENNDYQSFKYPRSACLDSAGNIYVADGWNHRVCKWDKNGNAIGWIGGGSNGWQKGPAPSSGTDYRSFNTPRAICLDSAGNIYVPDFFNNRVCKWDQNGNALGWIGGGSNGWKTGTAPSAGNDYQSFNFPICVCLDSSGNIYVAETSNYRVSKWNSSGTAQGWFGGGSNGLSKSTAPTSGASDYQSFKSPVRVFNYSSYIYVADSGNNRVAKWSKGGNASGWIGGGYDGWKTTSSSHDGTDYKSFDAPYGVFVSSAGYIYVADLMNNRVCKWDSSGHAIGWIGGGSGGWKTTVAPSSNGSDYLSFFSPRSVFLDSNGILYIADSSNHRICKWLD